MPEASVGRGHESAPHHESYEHACGRTLLNGSDLLESCCVLLLAGRFGGKSSALYL